MKKKAILTAGALFVTYSIYVAYFAPKWWHTAQHQWQENIIKAQSFLYNESDTIQNVIIGSSLANRLIIDSLPKTYNLSFSGQSIFDGLNFLTLKSKRPKNIFIEMNLVLRPEDKNFTQSINSPILYHLRKMIISLREDKQPIAILPIAGLELYNAVFNKALFSKQKPEKNNKTEINSNDNDGLFSKILNIQIKNYSKEPDQEILDNSFNTLKEYMFKIENNQTNIVFFEMPVDNKLKNLPQAKTIRKTFMKFFPSSQYNYLILPGSYEYETTDGVHLTKEEALRYTIYFKSKNEDFFSH